MEGRGHTHTWLATTRGVCLQRVGTLVANYMESQPLVHTPVIKPVCPSNPFRKHHMGEPHT